MKDCLQLQQLFCSRENQIAPSILTLLSSRGGIVGIFMYQSMSTVLHLGKSTTIQSLGVETFKHPWTYQMSYLFPPPALVPLALLEFLAEHVTVQFRLLILDAPCRIDSLASNSYHHVGRCSFQYPVIKGFIGVIF